MNFTQLNLNNQLQRAIAEFGYVTPSPIQQKAIPPVLEGHDLIGCAQTGTGKTAAFALPMLQLLSQNRPAKSGEIRALILTPTRELALQIGQNFTDYGKYTKLRHAVVFGGVGQAPQVAALKKGLDVLIACPGRLNDLSNQGYVNLSKLEIFVLDEADRMLDMGFVHDVKRVVAKLPPKRQNLMFSATMPKEIEALATTFLTKPVMVKVNPVSSTVEKIAQSMYFVEKGNKKFLLAHLIKTLSVQNALVFSRTKHGADKIVKDLAKAGITAAAIHGNKGQTARVTALENFKAGKTTVLVATDIAARGIDINELSHVFNYDLPEVAETYVHRIGRTARAGAQGVAISFCATEEKKYLRGIEDLNRKQIPVVKEHPWAGKPSPVKVLEAPLRGRKSEQTKKESGRASQQPRKIAQAATQSPVPRQQKENTMNQNDPRNKGRNQAAPAQGNGQQNRNAPQKKGRNNAGKSHGNAPAQPKFDPRFLTPQAAEQVPHAPSAARAENAAQPEMLDVRRMHQQDSRPPRGQNPRQQGRNNRGQAAPNNGQRQPNDRANAPQGNQNGRTGQNNRNAPQDVRNNRNAPQDPRNNRSDRPEQNGQRGNQNQRGAQNQQRGAQNQQRGNQNGQRGNQNGQRSNQNGQNNAGKSGRTGLQLVRSKKPLSSNPRDPGLELISRRPPQQKFTSFDDYMTAHGGATAPVEEHGED